MDLKDVNREFQGKTFLMLLPFKGKNPLSANARLVFSYLHYRRMYKKGSSLEKMAKSDATPVLAPPIKSVEVAIPEEGQLLTQPENGDVLDLGEVLDLEALSNSEEDFDFLFEGVTDDMVA